MCNVSKINRCTLKLKNKIAVVAELQKITDISRNELFLMVSSSKKTLTMTIPCISTHHTFTLGLPRSCSECSLRGSLHQTTQLCQLTHPEMWNFASLVKTILLKKLSCSKNCAHAVYHMLWVSALPVICIVLDIGSSMDSFCRICNHARTQEIDVFRLCMKACLTWSTSSSDLLCHPRVCPPPKYFQSL
jgi:hypothetical protein